MKCNLDQAEKRTQILLVEKNELSHANEQFKLTCDDMQRKIESVSIENKDLV